MADDTNTKDKVVNDAEQFTPVHEEASNTFAAQYLDELFKRVQADDKTKDQFGHHQGATANDGGTGTPKPEASTPKPSDALHQGLGADASKGLGALFSKVKDGDPAATAKTENFSDGGALRVLKMDGAEKPTGQYVDDKGKTTTRIDDKTNIEYDPASGKYTKIDDKGIRTEIDPKTSTEKFGPQGKTLQQLIDGGVATEKDAANKSEKTTFLDGRVTTKFPEAKPGECSERTTFPPGQKDGLRQTETFKEKPPGDKPENSARTVNTFEDRKETNFAKGDIAKITAYKNPEEGKPAVVTEYAKGENGAYKGPNGAKSVENYKVDANSKPDAVKQVAHFEGKPDKITLANGDTRTPIGQGDRAGHVDVNKEGMPTHMKIGDRDVTVTYKDGKVNTMTVEQPGPPPSKLEMARNDKGELEVKKAEGKFAPDANGKINLEGLPIQTKDGKVVGDVHLNKSGDLKYKTGDGPDRQEIIKRADGSTEELDFKNWKKTTTSADGKTKTEKAWDGYEWRDFKMSADGKRTEFQPPDPKKPAFIERDTSGTPPGDKTVIGYKDGSKTSCDWQKGTQTEVSADGKTTTVRHYDGNTYREGKEVEAGTGNPPLGDKSKGDKVVEFKEGEPKRSLLRKDGTSVAIYGEGDQATSVEKGKNGQISEVKSPKGHFKFDHDADGDISKMSELNPDGSVKQTFVRRGPEQDPGMQAWVGREGTDRARQPGDKPPRDPFNAKTFNNWDVLDKDGNPVKGTDGNPITKEMNIHTTADGTIRFETPGKDGQPPKVLNRTPQGETYRETADSKIVPRPGNVSEIIDKKTGEKSLEFKRNGETIKIEGKNGPYQILRDGTVVQNNKDNTQQKKYLPDGTQTTSKLNADGTQTITELKVPKNDPAKGGEYASHSVPPSKSIEHSGRDSFKVVTPDAENRDLTTTYNIKERVVAQQQPGENFARAVSMDGGKYVGVNNLNGEPLLRVQADGSAIGPGGRKLDAKDWNFTADGISKDSDGNLVVKSTKPGSSDQLLMKPNGTIVETKDGKDKTIYTNGQEATFNADGSVKTITMNGKEYLPKMDGDKIVGLKPADGNGPEIEPLPKGTKYNNKLDEKGAFVSESKNDATGTTTRLEWQPKDGKYSLQQSWKTADGKDANMGYVADKDGNVSAFTLPPDRKQMNVEKARGFQAYKDLSASVKDGVLTVNIDKDGSKIVVQPDGSSDQTIKRGGLDIINHRDRDGNLLPTDKQVEDLGKLIGADLSKPEAQQQLAKELMSRFLFSDEDRAAKDQQTFLKALNEKLAAAGAQVAVQMIENKLNVVVTKAGGQPVKIPIM